MRRDVLMLVLTALVTSSVVTGCARRPLPEVTPAPAPAPTAAVAPTPPPPDPARPVPPAEREPAPPVPIARPAPPPAEFERVSALRPIYFDFDRSEIRPDAARTLDGNAAWLLENPRTLVLIEGHADERGTNEYNLALGERRARSARGYLIAQGVEARRLLTISYGEERPVCLTRNEACWARNRRGEFMVRQE